MSDPVIKRFGTLLQSFAGTDLVNATDIESSAVRLIDSFESTETTDTTTSWMNTSTFQLSVALIATVVLLILVVVGIRYFLRKNVERDTSLELQPIEERPV